MTASSPRYPGRGRHGGPRLPEQVRRRLPPAACRLHRRHYGLRNKGRIWTGSAGMSGTYGQGIRTNSKGAAGA